MMNMQDFGSEWDDGTTAITFSDRWDQLRVWFRYNFIERKGRYVGMHGSRVKNVAANWHRVYSTASFFAYAYSTATIVFLIVASFGHEIPLFVRWGLIPWCFWFPIAVGVAHMARRWSYVPGHRRLWVPNMWRLHVHNGRCCPSVGRHAAREA